MRDASIHESVPCEWLNGASCPFLGAAVVAAWQGTQMGLGQMLAPPGSVGVGRCPEELGSEGARGRRGVLLQ